MACESAGAKYRGDQIHSLPTRIASVYRKADRHDRREYLDQVFFWNQFDLQRKLDHFKAYYNEHRVHTSLNGKTPYEQGRRSPPKSADLRHFAWRSDCNGLYQIPCGLI